VQGGSPDELLSENISEVDPTWSPDGTQLAFGRLSNLDASHVDIQIVDMKTRKASSLPGSAGLFSPRWSPDGRYMAAISIEGSHKLMLYDFQTQQWSEWLANAANVGYPIWSEDSHYIYYDSFPVPKCYRLKLGDHSPQEAVSLTGLRRYFGVWGVWSGQTPDNSRLFARDLSTQDIYALDVDLP
jgi:hypothetical protein